jgi:hypothetical protein
MGGRHPALALTPRLAAILRLDMPAADSLSTSRTMDRSPRASCRRVIHATAAATMAAEAVGIAIVFNVSPLTVLGLTAVFADAFICFCHWRFDIP